MSNQNSNSKCELNFMPKIHRHRKRLNNDNDYVKHNQIFPNQKFYCISHFKTSTLNALGTLPYFSKNSRRECEHFIKFHA